ncbi:MAG: hypothetical protein GC204_03665 [Chloroflexi bacterium]|nr:hypothetical protein [Chloroflexota bacterium]
MAHRFVAGVVIAACALSWMGSAAPQQQPTASNADDPKPYERRIAAGDIFKLTLGGSCPMNDIDRYTGDDRGRGDPMGSAICRETYLFQYDSHGKQWIAMGLHENNHGKSLLRAALPAKSGQGEKLIIFWGRGLKYDASTGKVTDPDYGVIGKIEFVEGPH